MLPVTQISDNSVKVLPPISFAGSNSAFSAPKNDPTTSAVVGYKRTFDDRRAFAVAEAVKKIRADQTARVENASKSDAIKRTLAQIQRILTCKKPTMQRPSIKIPLDKRPTPIASKLMLLQGTHGQKRLCKHAETTSPLSAISFGQPMSALISSAHIVKPVARKALTPVLAKRTPTSAPCKDLTLSQLDAGLGKDSSPATSEKFMMRPFAIPEAEELECNESQTEVDASQRLELTEVNENGKRKRKTERELYLLRTELRKNAMWTRESIKKLRARHAKDFYMSEQ